MKTFKLEGDRLDVMENVGRNPDGTDALRAWSFVNLADADRQRAEFGPELSAPENAATRAKLDAARDAAKDAAKVLASGPK